MTTTKLFQLIMVAGHALPKPTEAQRVKFVELGGHVIDFSDKSIEMEFPSASAAAEFQAFASKDGAMFRGFPYAR